MTEMRGSVTSVTLLSLLGLTAAVAGVNITRNGKVFNVFQVTMFPNDECTVSGTKVAYYIFIHYKACDPVCAGGVSQRVGV